MGIIIKNNAVLLDDRHVVNLHGAAFFTTILLKDHEPQLWPLHWARLVEHARFFTYSLPHETALVSTLKAHSQGALEKARVVIGPKDFFITIDAYQPPAAAIYQGVNVVFSPFGVHPELKAFKTTSYLPYSLSTKFAVQAHAFEALMLDAHGWVVDGSRSSLLLYQDGQFLSLKGGLQGVMRTHVEAWLRARGLVVRDVFLKKHELAGHMLLCNSLMGVIPVGSPQDDVIQELISRHRPY